jgi:hypothetical protein
MSTTTIPLSRVERGGSYNASVVVSGTIDDGVSGRTLATRLAESGDTPSSLPPVDGGRRAWIFLAACFMLEGVAWGRYWSSKSIISS